MNKKVDCRECVSYEYCLLHFTDCGENFEGFELIPELKYLNSLKTPESKTTKKSEPIEIPF